MRRSLVTTTCTLALALLPAALLPQNASAQTPPANPACGCRACTGAG